MSRNRGPRVLVSGVVLGQPRGGVHRHNRELLPRAARLLEERGGALAVLEGRVPLAFELPPSVARIPSRVPAGPPLLRALYEGRSLRRALGRAAAQGHPFDLVHTAHLPAPHGLAVPFVLTLHDLRSLLLSSTPWARRLVARPVIARAVREAACVVAVSETVRAELRRRFGPRRVALVPNGADHLPVLPREAGADAPLLCVGHLEPRKNLELLLRALAAAPDLPALELVGAPRPGEEERLRRLVAALGLDERVRFVGPVDDDELARHYARAACVVFPSLLEGFGIPALEALRARVPLAVADAGALPEVAGPDVPRFPPDDPRACAAAVRIARGLDAATLERLAERAERFPWDESARRLVEAWEAALERPG